MVVEEKRMDENKDAVVLKEKVFGEQEGLRDVILKIRYLSDGSEVVVAQPDGAAIATYKGDNPKQAVDRMAVEVQGNIDGIDAVKDAAKAAFGQLACWESAEIHYPREVSQPSYRLVCSKPVNGQATAQFFNRGLLLFEAKPSPSFTAVLDQVVRMLNDHRDGAAKILSVATDNIAKPW